MKKFFFAILIFAAAAMVIHGFLWMQIKDLQVDLRAQVHERPVDSHESIKKTRLVLEKKQRENRNRYQWINKGKGYVQIPVSRAFDYYLLSLPRD